MLSVAVDSASIIWKVTPFASTMTIKRGEVQNREEGEMAWKSKEEGEIGANLRDDKRWGMGNLKHTAIPLGLLRLPWSHFVLF